MKNGSHKEPINTKEAIQALAEVEELCARFEKSHPGLAEAIRLFEVTDEHYQRAMNALYDPPIYTCSSSMGVPYDNLDRDRQRD